MSEQNVWNVWWPEVSWLVSSSPVSLADLLQDSLLPPTPSVMTFFWILLDILLFYSIYSSWVASATSLSLLIILPVRFSKPFFSSAETLPGASHTSCHLCSSATLTLRTPPLSVSGTTTLPAVQTRHTESSWTPPCLHTHSLALFTGLCGFFFPISLEPILFHQPSSGHHSIGVISTAFPTGATYVTLQLKGQVLPLCPLAQDALSHLSLQLALPCPSGFQTSPPPGSPSLTPRA